MNPDMLQMQHRYQDYQRELESMHRLARARRERQEAREQDKAASRPSLRSAHA